MKTKQITQLGMLLSISLVLGYLESLLPVMAAVPGVKTGLANIVTMLVLYRYGGKQAFFIMLLRVTMAGFLYSGVTGIPYGGRLLPDCHGTLKTLFPFFHIGRQHGRRNIPQCRPNHSRSACHGKCSHLLLPSHSLHFRRPFRSACRLLKPPPNQMALQKFPSKLIL